MRAAGPVPYYNFPCSLPASDSARDTLFLVESHPSPDTKAEALRLEEQGGGPVATALVALSRLGVRCRFMGVVGSDRAGEAIRDSLEAEGVDASGLKVRDGTSQRAFIVVERASARRTILWKRPSGGPLLPEELGPGFLAGSDFLLIDALMSEASVYAAAGAGGRGCP